MRTQWAYPEGWQVAHHQCARCRKQIRVVATVKHIRTRTAEFYQTNPGGPRGYIFCTDCRSQMRGRA